MDIVKELASVLQMAGGWGLSAVLMYVVKRLYDVNQTLQRELRVSMVDNIREMSGVISDNTHAIEKQVEEQKEARRLLNTRS